MPDLLLEIGLEEIPARMIAGAEAELLRRTLAMLGKEALLGDGFDPLAEAKSYSTPRRLAVLVKNVKAHQADITEEVTGPATKIAYKDGLPTPAAEAFAKKNGIAVADLKTITTQKGEYLAATTVKKGRSASEVIASELPKEIAAIYWAKSMYWRAGKPERFVRPVMWMVCLLGDAVVPVEFGGKTAGRASFGHRVLSSGEAFEIQSPESYLAQLEGEYVLADVEARRHKIRKALDKVTRAVAGARWREDEALVDTVTHLTEWPDVLLGDFEAAYLELPEEVLVTVMRDHQKYFAVEDANGKLAPHFLTVTNIALNAENTPIIRQGNERVLRARFNDARFFWEFDQRTPLTQRRELLKSVTFQKEVGNYYEKTESILNLFRWIKVKCAELGLRLTSEEDNGAENAARLLKCDLTCELVKEFTDLEGRIGGLYARNERMGEVVSNCIYWQYEPRNAGGLIPPTVSAQMIGLADRINTIVDMIALGYLPTGSKDPFGLRRSANGVVRILAEGVLPVGLATILQGARINSKFNEKAQESKKLCEQFFGERVDFYLREVRGHAYDVIKAVMAAGYDNLHDAVARAEAVTGIRRSEDFLAVSAAFKRMKNILTQARERGESIDAAWGGAVYPAEVALQDATNDIRLLVEAKRKDGDYAEALEAIATLRPSIDAFFDQVMILDPNPEARRVRLGMLAVIVGDLSVIADFSEIVVS